MPGTRRHRRGGIEANRLLERIDSGRAFALYHAHARLYRASGMPGANSTAARRVATDRPYRGPALHEAQQIENVGRCRRVPAAASRIFRASALSPRDSEPAGFAQASAYRRVESPDPPGDRRACWRSAVPRL